MLRLLAAGHDVPAHALQERLLAILGDLARLPTPWGSPGGPPNKGPHSTGPWGRAPPGAVKHGHQVIWGDGLQEQQASAQIPCCPGLSAHELMGRAIRAPARCTCTKSTEWSSLLDATHSVS